MSGSIPAVSFSGGFDLSRAAGAIKGGALLCAFLMCRPSGTCETYPRAAGVIEGEDSDGRHCLSLSLERELLHGFIMEMRMETDSELAGTFLTSLTTAGRVQVVYSDEGTRVSVGTFLDEEMALKVIEIYKRNFSKWIENRKSKSSYIVKRLKSGDIKITWRINGQSSISKFETMAAFLEAIEGFVLFGSPVCAAAFSGRTRRGASVFKRSGCTSYLVTYRAFGQSVGYVVFPTEESARKSAEIFKATGEIKGF